jgi:hypothetical protein
MENELNELIDELYCATKLMREEVGKIVDKSDLTAAELDNIYKAACVAEKLKSMDEYDDAASHGGYYTNNEWSGARRRSPVTGRYISRGSMDRYNRGMNGYSGHSVEDRMIASLEEQMDGATTDYERKVIMDEINRIRSGVR